MYTERENFIRFFQDEGPQWTPSNLDTKLFAPDLLPDYKARGVVAQQTGYSGAFGGKDAFGVDWVYQAQLRGSIEKAPLLEKLCQWESHLHFPQLERLDWRGCAEKNRRFLETDKLLWTPIFSCYFERLISLVGFEEAAVALLDAEQKPQVHRLFQRLTDLYIQEICLLHRHFRIELVEIHDDWGAQGGPLFSPETHREMLLPHLKRLVQAAHKEGVLVEQHSCGRVDKLVPNMIDSGVDTWVGQEITNKHLLIRQYGGRFKFGVTLELEGTWSRSRIQSAIDAHSAEYRGKKVWFHIRGNNMTREQIQETGRYLRSLPVLCK